MGKKIKKIKRVKDFLGRIDWMFNLNNYRKSYIIKNNDDKEGTLASIYYLERYQEIKITLWPRFFKEPLRIQRKILLHELCHTITIPSKTAMNEMLNGTLVHENQIEFMNEKETSIIENIIDSLFEGNLKYAKKAYKDYLR